MCTLTRFALVLCWLMPAWGLPAGWARVLDSLGLEEAGLTVLEGAAPGEGIVATGRRVLVRGVRDSLNPELQVVWQQPLTLPVYETPEGATVFTRERWSGAPLAAGWRKEGRVYFWTAAPLGERGYERYPYLPQALAELGLRPRAEARTLAAFFDSSYRLAADPDYLAARWRAGGIGTLHVAAWHYWEADEARDAYLRALIAACHRHAITVSAWLEFPHVSERFWAEHAEWREQTATHQDAQLDWRKLMNLADRECAAAVAAGLENLIGRFDWDGVNLAELYFESLEGYLNPARFTPFHAGVRAEARAELGFDPDELYDVKSARYHRRDSKPMRRFLDFRARLAARLQGEWLQRLERLRAGKPYLEITLTHIDDRYDATMRDKLGADAGRLLPVAQQYGATFLIEDPATLWHLGPERYEEMARRYAPLTAKPEDLALDINVVERYQDVYPTKQQTGAELFQLVRGAARAFGRVALYFENSVLPVDWPLLAAAAAPGRAVAEGAGLRVEAKGMMAVEFGGCAVRNGERWPFRTAGRLLVPAGRSRIEGCAGAAEEVLLDFNGTFLGAERREGRWWVTYEARGRAIAVLRGGEVRMLEPGRHTVELPE